MLKYPKIISLKYTYTYVWICVCTHKHTHTHAYFCIRDHTPENSIISLSNQYSYLSPINSLYYLIARVIQINIIWLPVTSSTCSFTLNWYQKENPLKPLKVKRNLLSFYITFKAFREHRWKINKGLCWHHCEQNTR